MPTAPRTFAAIGPIAQGQPLIGYDDGLLFCEVTRDQLAEAYWMTYTATLSFTVAVDWDTGMESGTVTRTFTQTQTYSAPPHERVLWSNRPLATEVLTADPDGVDGSCGIGVSVGNVVDGAYYIAPWAFTDLSWDVEAPEYPIDTTLEVGTAFFANSLAPLNDNEAEAVVTTPWGDLYLYLAATFPNLTGVSLTSVSWSRTSWDPPS